MDALIEILHLREVELYGARRISPLESLFKIRADRIVIANQKAINDEIRSQLILDSRFVVERQLRK
jgi:hypothetical protein